MKNLLCVLLILSLLPAAVSCQADPPETAVMGSFAVTHSTTVFSESKTSDAQAPCERRLIPVPLLCQYPSLPTGCEAVAAAMVLQYYGVSITAEEFARDWLECSLDFYTQNGRRYGPDPNRCFVGDPFSTNSYGCFAGPIVSAVNRNAKGYVAKELNDLSLPELCATYVDRQQPLLIWATTGMKKPSAGNTWYFKNGERFTWIAGEHCLVLVGYDDDFYYLNDPTSGSTVAYQKHIVEQRFEELGCQAILIVPERP